MVQNLGCTNIDAANKIILATIGKNGTLGMNADKYLAQSLSMLIEEYKIRLMVEEAPSLTIIEGMFSRLESSVKRLTNSLNETLAESWSYHFFATEPSALASGGNEIERLSVLLSSLLVNVQSAQASLQKSRGETRDTRLITFEGGKATSWLYGYAIPDLYEKTFKAKYWIHGNDESSAGRKFAEALLTAAGLPGTSASNLRYHATKKFKNSRCSPMFSSSEHDDQRGEDDVARRIPSEQLDLGE